jgi:hypothetical protein
VVEMTAPVTYRHGQQQAAVLQLPEPYSRERFEAAVGERAGCRVELVPMRLPAPCRALWLGYPSADRFGYNQDWPGHEVELAGHAIGHLLLGHCTDPRDGGRFACTATRLSAEECRMLSRFLPDPADSSMSRMFSDGEEHEATAFGIALAELLGISSESRADGELGALRCVG